MRHHKTALNLVVIDFNSLAEDIAQLYYQHIRDNFGVCIDEIPEKDANRLLLYFTHSVFSLTQGSFENKKNIIVYVNRNDIQYPDILKKLEIIAKHVPILIYYGFFGFNVLQQDSGESKELINNISEFRLTQDFSKYTPRKIENFYRKHQLQSASFA